MVFMDLLQLSSGQLYKDGQLNLLCVMELMNQALQLMREEYQKIANAPKLPVTPAQLQEECQRLTRVLQRLHLTRYSRESSDRLFFLFGRSNFSSYLQAEGVQRSHPRGPALHPGPGGRVGQEVDGYPEGHAAGFLPE